MAPANAARALDVVERGQTSSPAVRVVRRDDEIRIIPIRGADLPGPAVDDAEEMLGAEAWYDLPPLQIAAAVDRDLSTSRAWLTQALGRAMDQA